MFNYIAHTQPLQVFINNKDLLVSKAIIPVADTYKFILNIQRGLQQIASRNVGCVMIDMKKYYYESFRT